MDITLRYSLLLDHKTQYVLTIAYHHYNFQGGINTIEYPIHTTGSIPRGSRKYYTPLSSTTV